MWKLHAEGNPGGRGFTLLEVMVAVALVATAFTSLLTLQRQSVSAHGTMRQMTVASMLAEDRLERMVLRAQGFDRVIDFNDELERRYPEFTVEAVIDYVDPQVLPVVALLPAGLTLREIRVSVTWRDGRDTRTYELRHFVTEELI
jgi:type II secretion system protein I